MSDLADAASSGRCFYIDPAGSDDAQGASPASAWQSLERANHMTLAPGDRLLLRGEALFAGTLHLTASDAGDPERPVVIGSYGGGRAVITGNGNAAVYIHNTASVEVRDLVLVGDPAAYHHAGGVSFYNDSGKTLSHVVVDRVDASGFKHGIELGGSSAGFRDVQISRSVVHRNLEAGLACYGDDPHVPLHADITVSDVEAYENPGDGDNLERNTGSGIVLGSVCRGTVRRSMAHHNGWLCAAPEGPAGIWAYDSTEITIEHNVAHHNRTARADGDGFDLDQNTSSSVMQHNVAYDNDGAGFLLYTGRPGTHNDANVVRHNVSIRSPRASQWYGGITIAGKVTGARVYGNTSLPFPSAIPAPALRLAGMLADVIVSHNVLGYCSYGRAVDDDGVSHGSVVLQDNEYIELYADSSGELS